jgi:hypothetical protein
VHCDGGNQVNVEAPDQGEAEQEAMKAARAKPFKVAGPRCGRNSSGRISYGLFLRDEDLADFARLVELDRDLVVFGTE